MAPCKVHITRAVGSNAVPQVNRASVDVRLAFPANCGRITAIQLQARGVGQSWDDGTAWQVFSQAGLPFDNNPEVRIPSDTSFTFTTPSGTRSGEPTSLFLRFRALSDKVARPASDEVRIFVGSVGAPTGLRAIPGRGSVTLHWNPQPGKGITAWQYQYKSSGNDYGQTFTVARDSITTVVQGLSNNIAYTFRLRFQYGSQDSTSGWSQEITATPMATPVGITLSASRLTVAEGGSSNDTIALDARPSADVVVTVAGAAGDVTVNPERLTFTTGNFNVAQSVVVAAEQDDDAVTDPVVTLTYSASGGGYNTVDIDDVVVVVTEDDTAGVTLSDAKLTVREVTSETYSVRLDTLPSVNVTVAVGGATSDVTVNPDSLTFTGSNFNNPQKVTVTAGREADTIPDDTSPEVTLTHSASGGDYGSVTIDSLPITVTAAALVSVPSTLSVAENTDNAEVIVSAAEAFGESITFNVAYGAYGGTSATGASAPADGDYDNDQITFITFQSTDTSKNITIPITDNTLDEDNETFTVIIELAEGSTLPPSFVLDNATITVTITDDDTLVNT